MTTNTRRQWLGLTTAWLATGTLGRTPSLGDDLPRVENPRATDGDDRFEPDWSEKLTVTVGTSQADFVGKDNRALQGALDYVARFGGGTVHVQPGTYVLRNAIVFPSKVRLLGSGLDSVLTKIPSDTAPLQEDSDWYDREITLANPSSFRVGDGVVLRATDPSDGRPTVIKRTLVARNGNRFKLDRGLRENLWLSGNPTCSSLFPLLTSEYTRDVVIENITMDGNRANNENFNGNYGGCIFLQDCQRYHIRGVTTRNYNGDGISFQICHDVLVEDCHSHDNQDLGVHPGSGSQRPILRRNRLINNSQGIFWCWGVKYGIAEDNTIDGNRLYGISIGHNDTDNVMVRNRIRNSGKIGVLFRNESRGRDFYPNRNTLLENEIIDSGDDSGIAIDIQGKTKDLQFRKNRIVETRNPAKRIGVKIGRDVGPVELAENAFQGFAMNVLDERST